MTLYESVGVLTAVVALLGYLNYRFIGLPDSIGITAMGMLLSLAVALTGHVAPGVAEGAVAFANRVDFTRVVFEGLLGLLLFAGSLHIDFSALRTRQVPVLLLATAGVLLSTLIVGLGSYAVLWLLGTPVPLLPCLVFGALISPTDPVAVLSILKTADAPAELQMDIAGESLFNDGTGVVVYLLLLGIATGASEATPAAVSVLLVREVAGALGVGVVAGAAGVLLLKGVDSYPVEILITIALATGGYALAERLHVSAPLAVVVMGILVGNRGAHVAMSDETRRQLFSFWGLLDQILNLVLFGLIGLKLLALVDLGTIWLDAIALVPVVLAARFLSVSMAGVVVRRALGHHIPHAVKILTWGGLRGGISIALALSLPDIPGHDAFVTATYAVVLFSLLVQAPTLRPLLRKWNADR